MNEDDLKNLLVIIARVNNFTGAEVEAVAVLKQKIATLLADLRTPQLDGISPPVNDPSWGAQKPTAL